MMKLRRDRFAKLLCMCFCCLFLNIQLSAAVYSLWPFATSKDGKKKTQSQQGTPSGVLPAQQKRFWQEDVIVNGNKLCLNIYLLEGKWDEIASHAKMTAVKGSAIMGNSNSLYIQNPVKDGLVRRTYYLNLSGTYPMLMFQMQLPQNRLKMEKNLWPENLPLLNNASQLNCMVFPARNAVFGSYDMENMNVSQALSSISAAAAANGWAPLSGEARQQLGGSGEVFFKENPSRVLIFGLQELPAGKGVRISLYTRQL